MSVTPRAPRRSAGRSALRIPAVLTSMLVAISAAVLGVAAPASATDASMTGTVQAQGGAPLAGVTVELVQPDFWGGYSSVTSVVSGASGEYAFSSLDVGTYSIRYTAADVPGGPWGEQWYLGAADFSGATLIEVVDPLQSIVLDAVELEQVASRSGTVTDSAGQPIVDVEVSMVYSTFFDYVYRSAYTDANGDYTITSLPQGSYELRFDPYATADRNFVREVWNDVTRFDQATLIEVVPGDVLTGFDAELATGGVISGTVVAESDPAVGLAGMQVIIEQVSDYTNFSVTTASDGTYAAYGLAVGQYLVQFREQFFGPQVGYVPEWWDGAANRNDATPVPLAEPGAVVSGIDGSLALGGTITGTVTGPTGEPLQGVFVDVSSLDPFGNTPPSSVSDAEGTYTIVGLSGTYSVRFNSNDPTLRSQFFDGVDVRSAATPVTVVPPETIAGIDGQLRETSTISGRVTDENGIPLEGISVQVYSETLQEVRDASTNADGEYIIGSLPPADDFLLQFTDFDLQYQREFYDDAARFEDADPITLGEGEDKEGIDAVLTELGIVSGTVTDLDGTPLEGIAVLVLPGGIFDNLNYVTPAVTNSDGQYVARGVPAGSAKVLFEDAFGLIGDGGPQAFRSEWWNDRLDPAFSDGVNVVSGETTGGVDAQLAAIDVPDLHSAPTLTNIGSVEAPVIEFTPPTSGPAVYGYSVAVDGGAYGDSFYLGPLDEPILDFGGFGGGADDHLLLSVAAAGPDGQGFADRMLVTVGAGPAYAVTPAISLVEATPDSLAIEWAIPSGTGVDNWTFKLFSDGPGLYNDEFVFGSIDGTDMLEGSALVEGLSPDRTYQVYVRGYTNDFEATFFGTTTLQTQAEPVVNLSIFATDVEAITPLEGADVGIVSTTEPGEVVGVTNAAGLFERELGTGTYIATIEKPGYSTYREQFEIAANGVVEIEAPLYPARSTISGSVRDADGNVIACSDDDGDCPVVTATLVGTDIVIVGTVSAADGAYTLSGLWEGEWSIGAAAAGYSAPAPRLALLNRDDDVFAVDLALDPISVSALASNVTHTSIGRQVTVDFDVDIAPFCTDGYLFLELVPPGAAYDEGLGYDVDGLGWLPVTGEGSLQVVFEAPGFDEYQLNFSSISVSDGQCATGPDDAKLTAPHVEHPLDVPMPGAPAVNRIEGIDRFATAAQVAAEFLPFPDGEGVVYIANGLDYPDALSAAPAAAFRGAPLLLTLRDSLPAPVREQLQRLSPELIVIAGGTGVVSPAVEAELRTLAPTVERHSGIDRYETSRELTRRAFGDAGAQTVFLATGTGFPDALSASAAAGRFSAPVVLVNGSLPTVPAETLGLLDELNAEQLFIAGGEAVVSESIRTSLLGQGYAVTRLSGIDRYATSAAINDFTFATSTTVFLAVGTGYADALAGAALAGNVRAPLFVVPGSCVPQAVLTQITDLGATQVRLLGGTGALSTQVAALTRC